MVLVPPFSFLQSRVTATFVFDGAAIFPEKLKIWMSNLWSHTRIDPDIWHGLLLHDTLHNMYKFSIGCRSKSCWIDMEWPMSKVGRNRVLCQYHQSCQQCVQLVMRLLCCQLYTMAKNFDHVWGYVTSRTVADPEGDPGVQRNPPFT